MDTRRHHALASCFTSPAMPQTSFVAHAWAARRLMALGLFTRVEVTDKAGDQATERLIAVAAELFLSVKTGVLTTMHHFVVYLRFK